METLPKLKKRRSGLPKPIVECRKALWNALKQSVNGDNSNLVVKNEFVLDEKTAKALGKNPIIFNHQNISIDVNLHNAVLDVVDALGQMDIPLLRADKTLPEIIEGMYRINPNYTRFATEVCKKFIEFGLERNGYNKTSAASEMGMNRTTLVDRCRQHGVSVRPKDAIIDVAPLSPFKP
jgi:transcriptional regulator with GAF, ATPase, and Fis domain